ncbi:MAG: hypothetical protein MN733_11375 [Nitrososphaera sp.]|nr:hypothetical protein [Nitrososphaera sp.]
MKYTQITALSEERRQPMRELVKRWKGTGSPVSALEESLKLLSRDKRSSALSLIGSADRDIATITCTYGKGSRPKLALDKADARMLLVLVSEISSCNEDETMKSRMMDIAASVIIGGEKPPSTLTDPRWKPLLDLIGSFDPTIKQGSLF